MSNHNPHNRSRMKSNAFLMAILAIAFGSCASDAEEELYPPNGSCNTANVTYAGTVNNLLGSYGCLGCHSNPSPQGNINLQGHTNVKAVASSGRLYGAISHAPGFHPMPQGASKMNACDINKIKAWIDAGAPNN